MYRSASSIGLTGTVTLDAAGDPDAVFVFQALITASASRVKLVIDAQPCNVFWQVGSSATLGTTTVFSGNILALASITINDGVSLTGRALARNGAVTLIDDTIVAAHCAASAPRELDLAAALPAPPGPRRPGPSSALSARAGSGPSAPQRLQGRVDLPSRWSSAA